jgi:hypothetical protein
LEVYDGVAGVFLALAGFGEEAVNIVTAGGGEFVFDAPDFAQDKVPLGRFDLLFLQKVAHGSVVNSSGVASSGRV